jgi:hypothetical protein
VNEIGNALAVPVGELRSESVMRTLWRLVTVK